MFGDFTSGWRRFSMGDAFGAWGQDPWWAEQYERELEENDRQIRNEYETGEIEMANDDREILNLIDKIAEWDTEGVLTTRAVVSLARHLANDTTPLQDWHRELSHKALVALAKATPAVMQAIADNKKIQAIKELRAVSNSSLKEAKDAVEEIDLPF
jgi:ribosomal protein L7/L12